MLEKKEVINSWKWPQKEEESKTTKQVAEATTKKAATKKEGWIDLGDIQKPKKTKQKPLPPSSRKVKKGTKLWMKWILILWGIFFFFLIILLFLLIAIISNPDMGNQFWFSVNTNKQISMSIAFLIFVPFFMLFLILFLIYAYRLITSKVWKVKNIAISITIFVLWLINITAWTWTFLKISEMGGETKFATNDILVSYIENIETDDDKPIEKKIYEWYWYPLIAPMRLSFEFNTSSYNKYQKGNIEDGNIIEKKFIIHCGNGITKEGQNIKEEQIIEFTNVKYVLENNSFSSTSSKGNIKNFDKCLYTQKWHYTLTLELEYEWEWWINTYDLWSYDITIDSHIEFTKWFKLTDNKSWLIMGTPDSNIVMDFGKILTDLDIDEPEINIDFDGDKQIDTQIGKTSYTNYVYDYPKNYTINYQLLGTDYPVYKFEWIVESWNKPTCEITYENIWENFTFSIKAQSRNKNIEKYTYLIKNSKRELLKRGVIKWQIWNGNIIKTFEYKLKEGTDYIVEMEIEDSIWDTWKCKTDTIVLSNKKVYDFDISLETTAKWKTSTSILTWDTLIVKRLPTKYVFEVTNLKKDWIILENMDNIKIGFDTTNNGIINVGKAIYETTIKTEDERNITVIIEDDLWNKYERKYQIKIDLDNLITDLKLDNAKWEVPFLVTFDASASEIIDKNDEILKFKWDFGDGSPLEESREWIREHTYKKEGRYEPKVTIVTAKWKENTTSTIVNAQIWVKAIDIIFDSHPTWTAWEWDRVIMNVKTWWVGIKKINWNFGDGKKFTCEKSECFDTVHVFEEAGNYKITAKVYLQDNSPPSSGRKAIKIKGL